MIDKVRIFNGGDLGYTNFRIPAIVFSANRILLAFSEARRFDGGDWAHSSLVLRRCTNPAEKFFEWEPARVLFTSERLVEADNWLKLPYIEPYACIRGVSVDDDDFKPLVGIPTHNPVPIVDMDGKTIHLLFCEHYDTIYYTKSLDDGETWEKPVNMTRAVEALKADYPWVVVATGPGHGLQVKEGDKTGRLVVPVWLAEEWTHHPSRVATIFSDDGGETWQAGEILPANIRNPNESVAVELGAGQVLLNTRNEHAIKTGGAVPSRRAKAISPDGASNWSGFDFFEDLPESVCMGSMIRVHAGGSGPGNAMLLYTGPDYLHYPPGNIQNRRNLTIWLSLDGGVSWKVKKTIEPSLAGYSDIAIDEERGWIHVMYEEGGIGGNPWLSASMVVARLNREWLIDGTRLNLETDTWISRNVSGDPGSNHRAGGSP